MIKENVYFILGTPCSGKTTIANILTNDEKTYYFSGDGKRFDYYKYADVNKHIYMTKKGGNFFEWSYQEMIDWEQGVIKEQTPYILEDLYQLAEQWERVIFEGMIDIELLMPKIDKSRVIYLRASKDIILEDFFAREDHKPLLDAIRNTPDISEEEKKRRENIRAMLSADAFNLDSRKYGIQEYVRTRESTVEDMLSLVKEHFNI